MTSLGSSGIRLEGEEDDNLGTPPLSSMDFQAYQLLETEYLFDFLRTWSQICSMNPNNTKLPKGSTFEVNLVYCKDYIEGASEGVQQPCAFYVKNCIRRLIE
ncbi:hypothetical protein AVEN_255701-1 [Araneus ventricosus]|uniref:Uncharacterized protein n=1 Tax=Araneus ventricosus TaxID=182803 RepID=A0A4Y2MC89_ARAVE|nr:hypothetical protein AVEN_255701-1 [Araneus ventricosus]